MDKAFNIADVDLLLFDIMGLQLINSSFTNGLILPPYYCRQLWLELILFSSFFSFINIISSSSVTIIIIIPQLPLVSPHIRINNALNLTLL